MVWCARLLATEISSASGGRARASRGSTSPSCTTRPRAPQQARGAQRQQVRIARARADEIDRSGSLLLHEGANGPRARSASENGFDGGWGELRSGPPACRERKSRLDKTNQIGYMGATGAGAYQRLLRASRIPRPVPRAGWPCHPLAAPDLPDAEQGGGSSRAQASSFPQGTGPSRQASRRVLAGRSQTTPAHRQLAVGAAKHRPARHASFRRYPAFARGRWRLSK